MHLDAKKNRPWKSVTQAVTQKSCTRRRCQEQSDLKTKRQRERGGGQAPMRAHASKSRPFGEHDDTKTNVSPSQDSNLATSQPRNVALSDHLTTRPRGCAYGCACDILRNICVADTTAHTATARASRVATASLASATASVTIVSVQVRGHQAMDM